MLGSSFILGFILPLILDVSAYGYYREYMLYISYIAFLNLGYVDGIYIKYGGKDKNKVDIQILKKEHNFMFFFQLIVTGLFLLIAILLDNIVLVLFSLSIIPINMSGFHKMFLQATGQFKKYSKLNIMQALFNIIILVTYIIIIRSENPVPYIVINILVNFIILLIMEYDYFYMNKKTLIIKPIKEKVNYGVHIKIGFFILIANLMVNLFSTVGLWIVNIFLPVEEFAQYSFANSMISMILLIVTAASLTFYNFISKNENKEILLLIKNVLLSLGYFACILYFPLKIVVQLFLFKYSPSLNIIAVLMISVPYMMVINIIIINVYKARKEERKYLISVMKVLVINVFLNVILFSMFRSTISGAFSTSIAYIIWFVFSTSGELSYLKNTKSQDIQIITQFLIFIISSLYLNTLYGFILYLSYCLFSLYNNKKSIFKLLSLIKKK